MAMTRPSAQIFQFTPRPRSDAAMPDVASRHAADVTALRLPKVVVTGAWYHEAAVAEEETPVRH